MIKLKNIKMKPKLITLFLLVGIIPLLLVGWIASDSASKALRQKAFDQLEAVRELKRSRIEGFFNERKGDARVLADNPFVVQACKELNAVYDLHGSSAGGKFKGYGNERYDAPQEYRTVHDRFFNTFRFYMEQYGYYDVFLMGEEGGDTYFTVTKEPDFGIRASTVDSALRDVWQSAAREGRSEISDLKPYSPSGGIPAQFVAAPVKENGRIIGVVALQISMGAVNTIMQERAGMGESGESYLVGPDNRMRSDSFIDKTGAHSVKNSFAGTVDKNGIKSKASDDALAGISGEATFLDYNNHPVLSSYGTLKFNGFNWAVIAEIDVEEVNRPTVKLVRGIIIAAVIIVISIIILSLMISFSRFSSKISAATSRSLAKLTTRTFLISNSLSSEW
ncbi:MAG: hypothetical protein GY765_22990 [bacterium]|nr:hypothetical protein [bacterium]